MDQASELRKLAAEKGIIPVHPAQATYVKMDDELRAQIDADLERMKKEDFIEMSISDWIRRACRIALSRQ